MKLICILFTFMFSIGVFGKSPPTETGAVEVVISEKQSEISVKYILGLWQKDSEKINNLQNNLQNTWVASSVILLIIFMLVVVFFKDRDKRSNDIKELRSEVTGSKNEMNDLKLEIKRLKDVILESHHQFFKVNEETKGANERIENLIIKHLRDKNGI